MAVFGCPVFFPEARGKNHSNIIEVCFSRNISITLSSKCFYRIQLHYLCPPNEMGFFLLLIARIMTKMLSSRGNLQPGGP
jgi:hypothetical protein